MMQAQADALAYDALTNLADGVLLVDGAGTVVFLNPRAQELLELASDAWVGAPVSTFYRALAEKTEIGENLTLRFENHARRAAEMPRFDFVLRAAQEKMIQAKWFALSGGGGGFFRR